MVYLLAETKVVAMGICWVDQLGELKGYVKADLLAEKKVVWKVWMSVDESAGLLDD